MKTVTFKCVNCGECCQHLLEKTKFGIRGLNLQSDEIQLFPSNHVKPLYAVSKGKSRLRPSIVFTYQLDLDTCPHFIESKKCRIYPKRPLVCRSFPFQNRSVSKKCPQIDVQPNEAFTVDETLIQPELEAGTRHMKYLKPYLNMREYFSYDLETDRWLRVKVAEAV